MSWSYTETYASGSNGTIGKDGEESFQIRVQGDETDNADDPAAMMTWVLLQGIFGPVSQLGNIINRFSYERIAPMTWLVNGIYRNPAMDRQTGDAMFAFTTGGATQHITNSIQTVGAYTSGNGTPTNHKNAIGVTGSGQVTGVDIIVPQFAFETTHNLPIESVSGQYIAMLKNATGTVNSDSVTFSMDDMALSVQPGELLLMNARGKKRQFFGDWEITLSWSVSPNVTNVQIGDITVSRKNGWDYLWCEYAPTADTNANALAYTPRNVYVEQVYQYGPLGPVVPITMRPSGLNVPPWMQNSVNTNTGGALL